MSLTSKIGTIIGTATAYAIHRAGATQLGVVSIIYTHRKDIQRFAVEYSINKNSPDAVQNNLLEHLEYID